MSAQRRIDAFLLLADEELHAATLLQQGAPRQAAYYLQQAAEKAVRALLTASQVPFGTGHNLGYMATLLPESHLLRDRVRELDRHSGAATLYRYPAPGGRLPPPPDPNILAQDLADIRSFLSEVRRFLNVTG